MSLWFALFTFVSVFAPPFVAIWADDLDWVSATTLSSNLICLFLIQGSPLSGFFHRILLALPYQGTLFQFFTAAAITGTIFVAYFASTILLACILVGLVRTSDLHRPNARMAN